MDNFIKKLDIENSSEIECMSFKIILYNQEIYLFYKIQIDMVKY